MIYSPPSLYGGYLWAGRTVGLLGGSFNPAHEGHLHISHYALKQLGLDAVWWMVSPQNPLKSTKGMAPQSERIESAQRVANHPRIVVTGIEAELKTRYTVDTLDALHRHFPATRFVWLMGTDNLHQAPKWKNWTRIFETVPVCIFSRPPRGGNVRDSAVMRRYKDHLLPQEQARLLVSTPLPAWTILHIPLNHLSASQIRNRVIEK